jgi:hypothetical protein
MSQPLAHLYDLALRALDEQDRRADALRGRLGPLLAAAALGASLLSGPLIGTSHPATIAGKLAITVAVCGLLATVAGAFRLLAVRRRAADHLDPWELIDDLERGGLLEDEAAFHKAMIARLARLHERRIVALTQLASTFTAMLWGILVTLCGLALAAIVG